MPEKKRRFSDFAGEHQPLDGAKLKISDIFNKEIQVLKYRIQPSKYHKTLPCLQLQFEMDDGNHILFTSSAVLIEQIETYKNELPFYTTIKQVGNYYTLT